MSYKVGIGYDIHRLVQGRKLFLGGIEIPYIKGLFGHSDGDALLHAICDALLGAVAAGDIGEHFPDADPKYHNISSVDLLKTVKDLIVEKNFLIHHLDTIVVAQEPSLSPFKKQMQEKIAQILNIGGDCINIKAKTHEGIGELGQGEVIACYAIVTLITKEEEC